jgi:hypothetical protein
MQEMPMLGVPFHPRETNAMRFIPFSSSSTGSCKDDGAEPAHYLASCSVDTTCRLWRGTALSRPNRNE